MNNEDQQSESQSRVITDELVRVTGGLLSSRVSFDVVIEYLLERTAEMDEETKRRVIVFLVLDLIKEGLPG